MSSMSNVAGLSKYMKTLPKTKISVFSMIFLSFIGGAIIFTIYPDIAGNPILAGNFLEKAIYGGAIGFAIFGISGIMSGAIIRLWVDKFKGRNVKAKHAMFISLLSTILSIIICIIGATFSLLFNGDLLINSILFSCVLLFAFTILVIWGTSNISLIKSAIISAVQPVLTVSMLVVVVFLANTGSIEPLGLLALSIKIIIANIIFILAIYSFITVIESPMKKNLGFGVLELLSLFIAHVNEGSSSLEKLFEEIGEPIDTLVGIVSFRNPNTKEIKSLFLSPCVHPGPIGGIGGANMPTVLANKFDNFTMVAHGPSTHDFNPVSAKEIDKIENSIVAGLERIDSSNSYSRNASKFVRYTEKTANTGIQFFGDGIVVLSTFAPNGSDDIEFGVGLSIMNLSKAICNVKNSIVVDCHNAFNEEKGRILPGNPEVFYIMDAVQKIKCKDHNDTSNLKIGCSQDSMETLDKKDGVGQSGIKVMVIEVDNQKTAYILMDSNNMEIGFREIIMEEILKLEIDEIEVMTSDTHYVNTLSKGYNPLGVVKQSEILEYTIATTKKALFDLEEVEVGTSVEKITNLNTFGPNNSTELVSTISSIVSVSKIMAPIIFILAILFVFLWIFYLG